MAMTEDYRVTVTVPIYNSSECIDDCLDYLSEQTHEIFEMLFVVDERTTDGSEKILEEKKALFDNLRIIKQTDGKGLAGARNIGIRESKGDVIWFLDVDDIPCPTFLEELLKIMSEAGADTVVCNHFQTFERKNIPIPQKEYSYKVVDGSFAAEHYTDYPIYSWSRIQKRMVFNEKSMFRERPAAEDVEQTIRQFAESNKVCYYNKPLHTYVKSQKTSTKNNRSRELESLELTAESVLPFIEEELPEIYLGFRRRFLLNMMRQSAFSSYQDFKKWYKSSCCRSLVKEECKKTTEMRVFLSSKLLYYAILYPFSHYLWDRKKGTWGD